MSGQKKTTGDDFSRWSLAKLEAERDKLEEQGVALRTRKKAVTEAIAQAHIQERVAADVAKMSPQEKAALAQALQE